MSEYKRYQDLTGIRFGKWTVIGKGIRKSGGNTYWLCKCDCGVEKEVQRPSLIHGTSNQCTECSKKPKYIGGMYKKYYNIIKGRARKMGFDFEVTPEYLGKLLNDQNSLCILSGLPLDFHSNHKNYSGTASLDRIDSSKGYLVGNVQWVHRSINYMKGSLSDDDFITLCRKIVENCKDRKINKIPDEFFWVKNWKPDFIAP